MLFWKGSFISNGLHLLAAHPKALLALFFNVSLIALITTTIAKDYNDGCRFFLLLLLLCNFFFGKCSRLEGWCVPPLEEAFRAVSSFCGSVEGLIFMVVNNGKAIW